MDANLLRRPMADESATLPMDDTLPTKAVDQVIIAESEISGIIEEHHADQIASTRQLIAEAEKSVASSR